MDNFRSCLQDNIGLSAISFASFDIYDHLMSLTLVLSLARSQSSYIIYIMSVHQMVLLVIHQRSPGAYSNYIIKWDNILSQAAMESAACHRSLARHHASHIHKIDTVVNAILMWGSQPRHNFERSGYLIQRCVVSYYSICFRHSIRTPRPSSNQSIFESPPPPTIGCTYCAVPDLCDYLLDLS